MTVTEGQRSIAGGIERASGDKSYPAQRCTTFHSSRTIYPSGVLAGVLVQNLRRRIVG